MMHPAIARQTAAAIIYKVERRPRQILTERKVAIVADFVKDLRVNEMMDFFGDGATRVQGPPTFEMYESYKAWLAKDENAIPVGEE